MKRFICVLACAFIGGAAVWAEENPRGGAIVVNGAYGGKSAADWYIDSIDKTVHLNDAQKKSIREIFEARDAAIKEFNEKSAQSLREAGDAISKAFQSRDQEAIKKAQKIYQDAYAPMHEIMKKSNAQLRAVLTEEQRAAQRESQIMGMVKRQTDGATLTDEQIKRIKDEIGNAEDDWEGLERKLPAAVEKTLTDEQKKTIAMHRAMSYVKASFGRANLTSEQLKKAEAICGRFVEQGAGKTPGWDAYQKLAEEVRGILTDEQKEALTPAGGWANVRPGQPMTGLPGAQVPPRREGGERVQIFLGGSNGQIGLLNRDLKATRERVDKQSKLVHQAQELIEKIASEGDKNPSAAPQLWEQLERVQSQLRETLQPQLQTVPLPPGASAPQPGAAPALGGQPLVYRINTETVELRAKVQELERRLHEVEEQIETLRKEKK